MKRNKALLSSVLLATLVGCGGGEEEREEAQARRIKIDRNITLTWIAPTTNDDGSVLTDLVGYKVMYGALSGQYSNQIPIGLVTTITIKVSTTPQYFTVVAINSLGDESLPATEVYK